MSKFKTIGIAIFIFCCLLVHCLASSDITIAVPAFTNHTGKAEYDWFNEALADMITTDFASTKKIQVVSRVELKKILDEQQLSLSGLVTEESKVEFGNLIEADLILTGSYSIIGTKIRIDAKVFDVSKGIAKGAASIEGNISELFILEKMLTLKVYESIGIELDEREKISLLQIYSDNPDAIENNYKGVIALDNKNVEEAKKYFSKATKADPFYKKAKANLEYASSFKVDGGGLFAEALSELGAKKQQMNILKSAVREFLDSYYIVEMVKKPEIITHSDNENIVDLIIEFNLRGDTSSANIFYSILQNISEGEEELCFRHKNSFYTKLYSENFAWIKNQYYNSGGPYEWFSKPKMLQLTSDTCIIAYKIIWFGLIKDKYGYYEGGDWIRDFVSIDDPYFICGEEKSYYNIIDDKHGYRVYPAKGICILEDIEIEDLRKIEKVEFVNPPDSLLNK